MKTLDPVWNEKTQFIFFKDPKELTFNVWDWDKGTKHDPIGDYTLSLDGFFADSHSGRERIRRGGGTLCVYVADEHYFKNIFFFCLIRTIGKKKKVFTGPLTLKNVKKGELFVTVKCRKLLPIDLEVKAAHLQNLEKEQIHNIAEQEAQIASITKENESIAQANKNLGEEVSTLTASVKDSESKLSQSVAQKQALEEQKNNLAQIRASVQKDYGDISNQLVFLQSALEEEQDAVTDLASENSGLKVEQKTVASDSDNANLRIARLEEEIARLKQQKAQEKTNSKPAATTVVVATDKPVAQEEETKATSPLIDEKPQPAGNAQSSNCQCCIIL
ncbi:hypothetical protein RFI_08792 [Reticulomyxa filosa]|uniref:C2 domain-containing protein n=1 Tax=Reticulomyxa filosa TaxID=46433 RepID=X6NRI6_RETFI|nr:hypothetical protein RFI_08792 [Reticulomyxa filosa]|eukprot:ETO28339.1 hypothetical protein RFI_08792 [Reticulomyxa filosa]